MSSKVRVGIIGCGLVTQAIHLPTLNLLADMFEVTFLCDLSQRALSRCSQRVHKQVPKTTTNAEVLCSSEDVDVVMVNNSDEFHCEHALLALKYSKDVFIEKPMALCERDAAAIIQAQTASPGSLVMIGYMRRYAAAFIDAVKEVGGMDQISYARVRDIIGRNEYFIEQSGTCAKEYNDVPPEALHDKEQRAASIMKQAFDEFQLDEGLRTQEMVSMWRVLGSLGSHDLSAMREIAGLPKAALSATLGPPFWTATFQYERFVLLYESGIDDIPRFDAHIEIFSPKKSVRVQWDTPFVKGLPVTMHVSENCDGVFRERTIRKTYEDPYTLEMGALYDMVVNRTSPKTSPVDAKDDLKVFQMIIRAAVQSSPSALG